MILEALEGKAKAAEKASCPDQTRGGRVLLLALATSLDALTVGRGLRRSGGAVRRHQAVRFGARRRAGRHEGIPRDAVCVGELVRVTRVPGAAQHERSEVVRRRPGIVQVPNL